MSGKALAAGAFDLPSDADEPAASTLRLTSTWDSRAVSGKALAAGLIARTPTASALSLTDADCGVFIICHAPFDLEQP